MFASRLRNVRRLSTATEGATTSPRRPLRTLAQVGAGAVGAAFMYHNAYRDVRSSAAYIYLVEQVALPLVRKIDPETAHNVGIWAAAYGFTPMDSDVDGEEPRSFLSTTVLGLQFRNPVGLAAGFDKGGEAMRGMLAAGFGFVEVGTITPKAQPGNPKPRMFRLPEDDAVINRYGFNSEGLEVVQGRVAQFWAMLAAKGVTPGSTGPRARPICGVNIGKNKEGEAIADYTVGMVEMAPLADYVTVNISSPNTPGLRSLQGREQLRELLSAVKVARDQLPWGIGLQKIQGGVQHILRAKFLMERRVPPPILVKIAPDLTEIDMADIAAVVMETGIDGIIVTNTTIARPSTLKADPAIVKETGGLSGQPLFEPSTAVLRRMYELTRGKVPLIGVGGIKTPEQAYTKIRNGASLVQLYTALAYEGPTLSARINKGLIELLKKDGFTNVAQAVGTDVPLPKEDHPAGSGVGQAQPTKKRGWFG